MRATAVIGTVVLALTTACSAVGENTEPNATTGNNTATNGTTTGAANCLTEPDASRVVTADWLNRSLTVLRHDCLIDSDCTIEDAIISTVDLEAYPPGPIEIEHIPGTCDVLVAVGPGFFGEGTGARLVGSPEVPPGGGLLRVNLDSGEVVAEIETTDIPMGLAITPDGATAFTANHGDGVTVADTMSVIDLGTNTETSAVTVGVGPEQVSLTDDGTWGLVNLAGEAAVRFFQTSDPAGTLSEPLESGNDPSDVAFVEDRAVVANSLGLNASIFDFSDPASPTKLEDVPIAGGTPYGVTRIPGTTRVLITVGLAASTLVELDVSTTPATAGVTFELPGGRYPIGVAVSPDSGHAFVAHARDSVLSVVDLATSESRALTWLEQVGPTYAVVIP